ncbi:MAG: flavin reductase, partial [Methanoregula sp.]|nr:flavin reductase [Methanoregula sp.]
MAGDAGLSSGQTCFFIRQLLWPKILLNTPFYKPYAGEVTMEKITLGPMPYMSIMPTLLVGANVKGKPNYMTAAWATVACMAPPMVCVAINKTRFTA